MHGFTIGPPRHALEVGLPGTGVSYTEQQSASRGSSGVVLFVLVIIGLVIALFVTP